MWISNVEISTEFIISIMEISLECGVPLLEIRTEFIISITEISLSQCGNKYGIYYFHYGNFIGIWIPNVEISTEYRRSGKFRC